MKRQRVVLLLPPDVTHAEALTLFTASLPGCKILEINEVEVSEGITSHEDGSYTTK